MIVAPLKARLEECLEPPARMCMSMVSGWHTEIRRVTMRNGVVRTVAVALMLVGLVVGSVASGAGKHLGARSDLEYHGRAVAGLVSPCGWMGGGSGT